MGSRGDVAFDRVAHEYDETRGGTARATSAARAVAGHLPAGPALEIGVGTGIVAQALVAEAPQLTHLAGADISAPMLARAAARLPGCVLRASALRLPFQDATFAGVVAVHVLHLVSSVPATVAEAARVLQPGGRFVVVHARPLPEQDDDLVEATRGLAAIVGEPRDSPEQVRAAGEAAGLRCLLQERAAPEVSEHSPADVVDLMERRSLSMLWNVGEQQWQAQVEPVLAALRALPDQDRARRQVASRTVSVFERD